MSNPSDPESVVELHAKSSQALDAETIIERWDGLPPIDPTSFRRDLDSLLNPAAFR